MMLSPRSCPICLASVTVLQHSFAYDYGLATEASKLFQTYEPRRDPFAGASLPDQGSKTSVRRNFKGQAMKAMKRSTAEDVSRPLRSSASDLVDYERRLIDEIKWHIEQASTKLDALSKLKRKQLSRSVLSGNYR